MLIYCLRMLTISVFVDKNSQEYQYKSNIHINQALTLYRPLRCPNKQAKSSPISPSRSNPHTKSEKPSAFCFLCDSRLHRPEQKQNNLALYCFFDEGNKKTLNEHKHIFQAEITNYTNVFVCGCLRWNSPGNKHSTKPLWRHRVCRFDILALFEQIRQQKILHPYSLCLVFHCFFLMLE